ncbi:unnamed protein product [Durusdinium trenchii]|uniref:WD repeat-containing protein 55 n=2 Tax=Durusdinium trenchii TaxID=1381693 RepID=A0ABP0RPV4_9DINO
MGTTLLGIDTKEHCFEAQFHPKRPLLACACITGEVELHHFDRENRTHELAQSITSHSKSCRAAKFLTDSILASTGADKFAALSDLETGKQVWRCKLKAAGYSLLALDTERFAIGDDDGGLRIFEGRAPKAAVSWSENTDFISDLAMGVDGTSLCAVSGDGTLAVYDVRKSGEKGLIAMSDFQDDELLSVAILRRGTKVICGTQTGVLPIFSWGDFGDQKDRINGHSMSVDAMVKLAEDSIITGSSDGKLRVVAVHSKSLHSQILGILGEMSAEYPIERLSLSPDASTLACSSHGRPSVQLWSTEAARRLMEGESWESIFEVPDEGAEGEGAKADPTAAESDDDSSEEEQPKKKRRKEKKKGKKNVPGSNAKQHQAAKFFAGL